MNFKRNFLLITALVGSVMLIAGCKDKKAFVRFNFIEEVVDRHVNETFDDGKYTKPGNYESYVAKGNMPLAAGGFNDVSLGSTYNVLTKYSGKKVIPSTGDQKLLVIPVQFKDFKIKDLGVASKDYINNLNKAFFGNAKNNRYVSVAEYYNRSSYGKLRISGKVCDSFYTFPQSVENINNLKLTRDTVIDCYDKVIDWYQSNYDDIDDFKMADGNVALYLVYNYPTELNTKNPEFFWAYTFSNSPLSWSSYSAMNALDGDPDAHTFIHECGHLFGLEDYYPTNDTDLTSSVAEPTGRIDMMDCSVGDHTALSKMMLDWVRPYHVHDTCEIKINALVDSGDLVLINDNWNGSVFDEYYLVEFYSPTGLNYYDTNNGNNMAKLPTIPGVKIYHVDARLGYFELKKASGVNKEFKCYCTEGGVEPKLNNVFLAHDNSTYTNTSEPRLKNNLYELQLNHVGHSTSGCATNFNLFRTGDEIKGLTFNGGDEFSINYNMTITGITYRDATIRFEKIVK